MSTHDDVFGARLGAALAVENRQDWLDVQRRALRRRRWLTRPTGLLAAALVIAGGGSLALGLGAKLLDRDVPPKVHSELHQMTVSPFGPKDGAPPWESRYPNVKLAKGSEHRVLQVHTRRGTISLYLAATTHGGYCYVTQGGGAAGGGCNDGHSGEGNTGLALSMTRGGAANAHGRYLILIGHVHAEDAYAVAFRSRGGPGRKIVLTEGWFVYDVPRGHWPSGAHPLTAIDVLGQDGRRLDTVPDPIPQHRVVHFPMPVASSIRLLSSQPVPNGGGSVTIWEGRDAKGDRCFRKLRDGKSQMFPAWQCGSPTNIFGYEPPTTRHVPVMWQMGLRNDARKGPVYGWAYAYGWVAPNVAALKLRFQDGSLIDIPLLHGDFLYVVPPAKWPNGHRPSILLAYDAQGRQVYRRFLYPRQHCIYPGSDPLCKNFGMGTG